MSEFFEAAEELFEETFPPKPGGLVDRHRKREADLRARQAEQENIEQGIEERSYRAVKIAPESPEIITAQTINVPAGGHATILAGNPYRYRATINMVTPMGTALLSQEVGAGLGGVGYTFGWVSIGGVNYLPQPLVLYSRAKLYAYNPGASLIQIAAITEVYAPQDGK